MVPHAQFLEFRKLVREIAEWHCAARVRDEAERAQLARGEREKRLDGVCGEVHRVDLLPGLRPRAACEVPEGTGMGAEPIG